MYQSHSLQKAQYGIFYSHRIVQVQRMTTFLHSLYKFGIVFSFVVAESDFMVCVTPEANHFGVG